MATEPLPLTGAPPGRTLPDPAAPDRLGDAVTVPGYEILDELGRGAMGVVYKARDGKLDRVVALKMVLAGGHASPEELTRFLGEAEAIAQLRHPNIVHVHEVGQHEGLPYFTLEYVPGGSLGRRLAGQPLAAADAARLVEALARAMQHAHDKGIVHRDLKPANVLLEEGAETPLGRCTPRVTDFGLAKRLEGGKAVTRTGAILGTPEYMAPEQVLAGRTPVGPSADVYALGAILYECLTGRPPFLAANTRDLLLQVVDQEPVPPRRLQPKVPRDLDTICLKCLHKDPARRYASALALAEDLRRFQAGEPIVARRIGALGRLARWVRRRPVIAGLLAALLVLAVVAGAGISWAYGEAVRERDRALKAERDQRQQLIRALASTARLAARRGDWTDALRSYDEALALKPDDDVPLRLGVLECLTALYQTPRLREELAVLAGRDDLGPQAGAVRLMQAYERLSDPRGDGEAPLELARQALALGLEPAEEAYARALLAPTVREATAHLQEAVAHDPWRRRCARRRPTCRRRSPTTPTTAAPTSCWRRCCSSRAASTRCASPWKR